MSWKGNHNARRMEEEVQGLVGSLQRGLHQEDSLRTGPTREVSVEYNQKELNGLFFP